MTTPITSQPAITSFLKTEQTAVGITSNAAQASAPAKDLVAQAMRQPDTMAALLNSQSAIAHHSNDNVILAQPVSAGNNMGAEQQRALVKFTDNLKSPENDSKLDLVAASASTLFNSHINATSLDVKNVNSSDSSDNTGSVSLNSSIDARSHTAVENGTDITGLQRNGFINVVGDITTLETMNLLTKVLNDAEAIEYQSSAKASQRAVNAAERAGQKGIDAAVQRRTGAISSGMAGLAGHGASTMTSIKAYRSEKTSIKNHLKPANKLEKSAAQQKNRVAEGSSFSGQNGSYTRLDGSAEKAMQNTLPEAEAKIQDLKFSNQEKTISANQSRNKAEYGNKATDSAQSVIVSSADVSAAGENKEAELARADQAVNNELSSLHQQTAKKAHDSRAALEQVLEGALSSNSNTGSAIAGSR